MEQNHPGSRVEAAQRIRDVKGTNTEEHRAAEAGHVTLDQELDSETLEGRLKCTDHICFMTSTCLWTSETLSVYSISN